MAVQWKYIAIILPLLFSGCDKKSKTDVNDDVSHLITGKLSDESSNTEQSTESTSNNGEDSDDKNNAVIGFRLLELEIDEPVSGRASLKIQLTISPTYTKSMTLQLKTEFVTATKKDVDVNIAEVIIPASSNSHTFSIDILGDDIDENNETFKIQLASVDTGIIDNSHSELLVTIIDSDDNSKLSFKSTFIQVAEGSGLYEAAVIISPPIDKDVNLSFKTTGIASKGQDYHILSKDPITVPKLQDEFFIELDILSDTIPEGGENIVIELLPPSNARIGEDNILTIQIPGNISLNDTGLTTWHNGNDTSSTSLQTEYPKQDAEYGHDFVYPDNDDGHAGFSYTKIDGAGNALPVNASDFDCIYDNRSNLLWSTHDNEQVLPTLRGEALKTFINANKAESTYPYIGAHNNFKAKNYIYYWFNQDSSSNGGHEGARGDDFPVIYYPVLPECSFAHINMGSFTRDANYCHTDALTQVFNGLAICGAKNWRLPTIEELRSLFNYGNHGQNIQFFKNMMDTDYISSTPSINNTGAAWCMNFKTSQVKLCNKQLPHSVRLVRSNE